MRYPTLGRQDRGEIYSSTEGSQCPSPAVLDENIGGGCGERLTARERAVHTDYRCAWEARLFIVPRRAVECEPLFVGEALRVVGGRNRDLIVGNAGVESTLHQLPQFFHHNVTISPETRVCCPPRVGLLRVMIGRDSDQGGSPFLAKRSSLLCQNGAAVRRYTEEE